MIHFFLVLCSSDPHIFVSDMCPKDSAVVQSTAERKVSSKYFTKDRLVTACVSLCTNVIVWTIKRLVFPQIYQFKKGGAIPWDPWVFPNSRQLGMLRVSCSQDSLSFSTFELDSQELIERWFQMQCGSNSHSLGLVMSENGLYHTQCLKPLHARHALPNVVQQSLGRLWVILIPLIHYVTI